MQNKMSIAEFNEQKRHWTDKKDLYLKKDDYKDPLTQKIAFTTKLKETQNSVFDDLPDIFKITKNDRRILAQIGSPINFNENSVRGYFRVLAKLRKENPTLNTIELSDLYEARGFGRVFKKIKSKKIKKSNNSEI